MLSYHQSFSSIDLFRQMDKEGKGYLTIKDFEEYFKDDEDF